MLHRTCNSAAGLKTWRLISGRRASSGVPSGTTVSHSWCSKRSRKAATLFTAIPFAACVEAKETDAAISALKRLYDLHQSGRLEINQAGMRRTATEFSPEVVRASLLQRWEEIILKRQNSSNAKRRLAPQETPRNSRRSKPSTLHVASDISPQAQPSRPGPRARLLRPDVRRAHGRRWLGISLLP